MYINDLGDVSIKTNQLFYNLLTGGDIFLRQQKITGPMKIDGTIYGNAAAITDLYGFTAEVGEGSYNCEITFALVVGSTDPTIFSYLANQKILYNTYIRGTWADSWRTIN